MELPVSVQEAVQAALDAMRADPIHDLAWPYRKQLYAAFSSEPGGQTAPGWLALLAAERVRPIAEVAYRATYANAIGKGIAEDSIEENLAYWLWLARGILYGLVEKDVGRMCTCNAHYGAGFFRNLDEIHYADRAAQEALHEISGGEPEFYAVEVAQFAASSDAAGSAAWAWAGRIGKHPANPEKLEEFWTWWLIEAVSAAWTLAHYPPN